jgi:hypothetical protein
VATQLLFACLSANKPVDEELHEDTQTLRVPLT